MSKEINLNVKKQPTNPLNWLDNRCKHLTHCNSNIRFCTHNSDTFHPHFRDIVNIYFVPDHSGAALSIHMMDKFQYCKELRQQNRNKIDKKNFEINTI